MVLLKDTPKKTESRDRSESTAGEKVLRRLNNEHKYFSALLDALSMQIKELRPGGKPDYYTMRDMVDYLINFPDQYHHPMEDAVYEKLRENHHGSTSMVIELLAEHNDMAAVTRSLKEKLDAMCSGSPSITRPILQAQLEEYLLLYRRHIDMEESKTFPLDKKYLKESDWQEIESSMRSPEDPVFGAGVTRRYRKVVRALESASGELAEDIAIVEWLGTQALLDSGSVLIDGASQVVDVMKHHTQRSWQEAFDLIKSAQQPAATHSNSDLPSLIISNNLRRARKCLRQSNKIRLDVKESLRESLSWERGAFGTLMNSIKGKDTS